MDWSTHLLRDDGRITSFVHEVVLGGFVNTVEDVSLEFQRKKVEMMYGMIQSSVFERVVLIVKKKFVVLVCYNSNVILECYFRCFGFVEEKKVEFELEMRSEVGNWKSNFLRENVSRDSF